MPSGYVEGPAGDGRAVATRDDVIPGVLDRIPVALQLRDRGLVADELDLAAQGLGHLARTS